MTLNLLICLPVDDAVFVCSSGSLPLGSRLIRRVADSKDGSLLATAAVVFLHFYREYVSCLAVTLQSQLTLSVRKYCESASFTCSESWTESLQCCCTRFCRHLLYVLMTVWPFIPFWFRQAETALNRCVNSCFSHRFQLVIFSFFKILNVNIFYDGCSKNDLTLSYSRKIRIIIRYYYYY